MRVVDDIVDSSGGQLFKRETCHGRAGMIEKCSPPIHVQAEDSVGGSVQNQLVLPAELFELLVEHPQLDFCLLALRHVQHRADHTHRLPTFVVDREGAVEYVGIPAVEMPKAILAGPELNTAREESVNLLHDACEIIRVDVVGPGGEVELTGRGIAELGDPGVVHPALIRNEVAVPDQLHGRFRSQT